MARQVVDLLQSLSILGLGVLLGLASVEDLMQMK